MNTGHRAAVQEAGLRDRLQHHMDSWGTRNLSQGMPQIPTSLISFRVRGQPANSLAWLGSGQLTVPLTSVETTATLEG